MGLVDPVMVRRVRQEREQMCGVHGARDRRVGDGGRKKR